MGTCGGNNDPTAATAWIYAAKKRNRNTKAEIISEEEIQMTTNKKAENTFKKLSVRPYQEILAWPETGKISLLKKQNLQGIRLSWIKIVAYAPCHLCF